MARVTFGRSGAVVNTQGVVSGRLASRAQAPARPRPAPVQPKAMAPVEALGLVSPVANGLNLNCDDYGPECNFNQYLGHVDKSDTQRVAITVTEFRGRPYMHVREWYVGSEDGLYHPGKGCSFEIEDDVAIDMANLFRNAAEYLYQRAGVSVNDEPLSTNYEVDDPDDDA